jgi:tRNA(His) guanylyltransferase
MKSKSLGDRMKENYEFVSQTKLLRRTPVIIRLDGKAFHSFTKGMERPFDERLINTMQETTQYLVKNIEGCEFGYTQSDEISLLLTDYKKIATEAWFDYKVQKICSIAASMCTVFFDNFFQNNMCSEEAILEMSEKNGKLTDFSDRIAFFDARCFNIPKDEVVNYFIFRQQDCTRNSIQMVGQANFSHKQLHKKSCDEIQEMLFSQKGINWNDIPTYQKRGTVVYKRNVVTEMKQKSINLLGNLMVSVGYDGLIRTEYFIDKDIPIFTQQRDFIQKWVDVEEKE